ncbi:MAG TPA: hypothetical protein VM032_08640 [Vicinamibacterales bacterium]|nr:hypothetical protein [Vicinamibacterales bacterium]
MANIIFIAHLPLIRMTRTDDLSIGGGVLTRLPWAQFDALSQGAFTDWQAKYERTDPVCFWFQQDMDLPIVRPGGAGGMREMKVPTATFDTLLPLADLELIGSFHDQLVDPLWAALALAAPGGVAAPPRSSFTFMVPAGEQHLAFGDRTYGGARVQGDTDLELAFLADGAGEPLPDDALDRASRLLPVARVALASDDLAPALRQLLTSADVGLTAAEQMLLAVAALENLLIPDVAEANAETLARRASHLLGHDDDHRRTVVAALRDLYRRRSAVIHADVDGVGAGPTSRDVAVQLLAGAVEGAALAQGSGVALPSLLEQVDQDAAPRPPEVRVPRSEAPGRAGRSRLGPVVPWFSGNVTSAGSLAAAEGTIISWSPLVGLQAEGAFESHPELGVDLGPVPSALVVSMEEKDIRRDFIARVQLDVPIAALAVARPHDGVMVSEVQVNPLTRVRDLAVTGLRLAGLDTFIDPALLGWYVYHGNIRHRRETVLRQSVLMAMQSAPPLQLTADQRAATAALWSRLARYEATARHDNIDRMMDLFRRVHDRHFLDLTTRASLANICLEMMIGPFRGPTAPRRLEALVAVVDGVPPESAAWFRAEGRNFRNAVAHGRWRPQVTEASQWWREDHEPLAHAVAILRAALAQLLVLWMNADPRVRAHHGPQGLLARTLGTRLA